MRRVVKKSNNDSIEINEIKDKLCDQYEFSEVIFVENDGAKFILEYSNETGWFFRQLGFFDEGGGIREASRSHHLKSFLTKIMESEIGDIYFFDDLYDFDDIYNLHCDKDIGEVD